MNLTFHESFMNWVFNYMNLRRTKQIAMSCMTMNISKNSYGSYEFYELSFQNEKWTNWCLWGQDRRGMRIKDIVDRGQYGCSISCPLTKNIMWILCFMLVVNHPKSSFLGYISYSLSSWAMTMNYLFMNSMNMNWSIHMN